MLTLFYCLLIRSVPPSGKFDRVWEFHTSSHLVLGSKPQPFSALRSLYPLYDFWMTSAACLCSSFSCFSPWFSSRALLSRISFAVASCFSQISLNFSGGGSPKEPNLCDSITPHTTRNATRKAFQPKGEPVEPRVLQVGCCPANARRRLRHVYLETSVLAGIRKEICWERRDSEVVRNLVI